MTNPEKTFGEETRVITAGRDLKHYAGAVNPPVYHVSTIISKSVAELKARSNRENVGDQIMAYGRRGTPTSWALENAVAELEGGYRTLAYPSGLAAIAGTLFAFLKSGDHLLMTDSVYAPTRRFCNQTLKRFGVET
ncbi:MAG TPA: cystathionine beta-lyase, partial [Deltaproteobacteria bacterium]|nr:cystathionine beta-lyase [Deltaproteobacteria bacterium]